MSLMKSPVDTQTEGILRMFSAGPFAPAEVTPVVENLTRRGYLRRQGPGRQGRILFAITQLGLSLLKRCSPQK